MSQRTEKRWTPVLMGSLALGMSAERLRRAIANGSLGGRVDQTGHYWLDLADLDRLLGEKAEAERRESIVRSLMHADFKELSPSEAAAHIRELTEEAVRQWRAEEGLDAGETPRGRAEQFVAAYRGVICTDRDFDADEAYLRQRKARLESVLQSADFGPMPQALAAKKRAKLIEESR